MRDAPSPIHADLERVAVILPSWVGDVVMATPVLRALRQHCDDARIVALMRPGLSDLLKGCPWIDHMVTDTMRGFFGPRRAGKLLRAHKPQAVLLLPNSVRSALTASFSRAERRVGYDRDGRGRLLTHRLPVESRDVPTSTTDYYRRLGEWALGRSIEDTSAELFVAPDERHAADQLLAGVEKPFVILNPGASKVMKRWPTERFIDTANRLRESHDIDVVVNGSPTEAELVNEIAQSVPGAIDLARRGVTLGSLKAVMARARLLITNDTGPRHLASAFGVPTITLFGPTDHRWTPTDRSRERIVLAEPFLPEEMVADRHADICDIARIPVGDVVAIAGELLESVGD